MAFRLVLIIDASSEEFNKSIIFKRSFATVEKQSKTVLRDNYRSIPANIVYKILEVLELKDGGEKGYFDSDDVKKEEIVGPPVYDLLNCTHSPVVAFKKRDYVYCCIVFDEDSDHVDKMGLCLGAMFAYVMLENMDMYLLKKEKFQKIPDMHLQALHKYASLGFPFGIPQELNIDTVLQMSQSVNTSLLPKTKGPTWRPITFKGKPSLNVIVEEKMSAVQFNRTDVKDCCDVFGTVFCKAIAEDSPEISVHLIAPIESAVLNQMVYHPSVQLADDITPLMKSVDSDKDIGRYCSRKIQFCPPVEEFPLCRYKAKIELTEMPFHCPFVMTGNNDKVSIVIQIKLNAKMKNSFEKFDLLIPFFNRGPIKSFRINPQSVTVQAYTDKSGLICSIGTRLPGKSNAITLELDVNFNSTLPVVKREKVLEGLNTYILLKWQSSGSTYSGLKFDSKSVELYPQTKLKVQAVHQFRSAEYKIWNKHSSVAEAFLSG